MIRGPILITGGAGFIGSCLARSLSGRHPHARIWALDSLHPQVHGDNACDPVTPERVEFVRGDIRDQELLDDLLGSIKPRLIYHFAAETGTGQSYDEIVRYCDVNVTGTARLIEAVRRRSSGITN
ncbi:MAG: GDP-mannose 4,6-dehydratase, partial [Gammaproteobacteria bacterium]